ncbi:hypothetical protein ASPWEDRAFT_41708 [Aspergillus wentii DTO 134E9]|uniref:F-box domain-containing protein n=1 Tax=Aspergillus wentii DTO 134E9 TaxID=1073089 RepID=A0A1L9RG56_ASPWE|nr:uncharacterized protein ASPWEDRAFT_41708 [Aspergillus wentii DTO 134E9]OJJ33833.1 hypothetical protein ASPWEDRAFT_41708 [Aspergillus wentii DTO 134E9]
MVNSPISKLSPELLANIFEFLPPGTALLSCLLCCKKWHFLAQEILYRDIVLNSSSVANFVRRVPSTPSTDALVQSITLQVDPLQADADEDQNAIAYEGSRATQQLWRSLDKLAIRIQSMTRLSSLSIFRTPAPAFSSFWISQTSLAKIVDNLPETCTSLEIDTRDNDDGAKPGSVHLCLSIRRVLPRLHYLRLRLNRICPEICGGFDANESDIKDSYKPSKAPKLKECIINLTLRTPYPLCSGICGVSPPQPSVAVMVTALQSLVSTGSAPNLEQSRVLDLQGQEGADPASYPSFIRRDILSNTSRIVPIRDIGGFIKPSWLIRVPDSEGGDLVSHLWAIETVAEGRAWQETERGTRLAAPVMRKRGFTAYLPVETRERFVKRTNLTCMLWSNEKVAGMRLLENEERGVLETRSVREKIPNGWMHLENDGYVLPIE